MGDQVKGIDATEESLKSRPRRNHAKKRSKQEKVAVVSAQDTEEWVSCKESVDASKREVL